MRMLLLDVSSYYCLLSSSSLETHDPRFPKIPSLLSFWSKIPWSTLSYALEKSKYMESMLSPFSRAWRISSWFLRSWERMDLPDVAPCCCGSSLPPPTPPAPASPWWKPRLPLPHTPPWGCWPGTRTGCWEGWPAPRGCWPATGPPSPGRSAAGLSWKTFLRRCKRTLDPFSASQ